MTCLLEAFKFRDTRNTFVGGVPVILNRISFSGELGYEIYCRPQYLIRLAEAIEEAGADLGYRWYGNRAAYEPAPRERVGSLGAGIPPGLQRD